MVERAKHRPDACRLFSRGVIFTSARVSLALLSLRKNGGLLVVYDLRPLWEKTNFPENLVTVFRHKIWHIRHGLTAIYQSDISFGGLTHQCISIYRGLTTRDLLFSYRVAPLPCRCMLQGFAANR